MKQCHSWCKPDNIEHLSGIKKVDYTIINEGSTIVPQIFQDEFPSIEILRKNGKKKITIILKYEEKTYLGFIGEDAKGRITIGVTSPELKQIIKNTFARSNELLQKAREESNATRKAVVIADEDAEYIEFYKTDESDTYEIKLSTQQEWAGKVSYRDNLLNVDKLVGYINNKGFYYDRQDIANFYLSLKSKPFTILAGISGTGKSKLVRLFAEAIGADFTLIPVKPDWSDATDLLGYRDLNQQFHPGRFIQVIEEAEKNLDKPYIVCLDEMNLARVEYYFSDFLSLIESRTWVNGEIQTDKFDNLGDKEYRIPENVYVVGTVNMDETTFQFSKKVLDRANTIELSEVNLAYDFDALEEEEEGEGAEQVELHNEVLKSKYLLLRECAPYKELATKVINQLIEINEILMPCGLEFAYRVRDEVVFYMVYNAEYELLSEEEAFDFQMLQKVLPRISGTSRELRAVLVGLLDVCSVKKFGIEAISEMTDYSEVISAAVYPRSAKKLGQMLRRYDEDGFTSFW